MSFADDIKSLAASVPEKIPHCRTEEATKQFLILPFIRTLGYNDYDPRELVPEFTADVDPKRVDRVDYAIMADDKPIMLFECKAANAKLDRDDKWSQLFTYFIATEAKFAILTNGVEYQFFSDLDQRSKLDKKPFLEFSLLEPIDESLIQDVGKFTKQDFDPHVNWDAARDLKYTREIKRILADQLRNPSDVFIKFLVSQMDLDRNITKAFRQKFSPLAKQAFNQFITDQAYAWMKSRPVNGNGTPIYEEADSDGVWDAENPNVPGDTVTTEDELQGYYIVKSVLHDVIDVKRVFMRDYVGACSVLLDDNQRRPICRLRFNSPKNKRLGLIDSESKREERVPIDDLDDIYKYADRLKATALSYDQPAATT